MTVNIVNTYSPLKRVILGDVNYDILPSIPEQFQAKIKHIIKQTIEDFNSIHNTLTNLGVEVIRPSNTLQYNNEIKTPTWSELGSRFPMSPRDIFLIIDNIIIEMTVMSRFRYFEHWAYKDIMVEEFRNGAQWFSMPSPALYDNRKNAEPLLEAAAIIQHDKNLFVSNTATANRLGVDWLRRVVDNVYTIHEFGPKFNGHLDAHFNIIRPGLLATYHSKDEFPEFFKNWEFINIDTTIDTTISKQQEFIHDNLQDDDHDNTVLTMNFLSIDENRILMYDHHKNNGQLLDQLNKHNIEVIFVPFRHCHFFNQGITCITLELNRD